MGRYDKIKVFDGTTWKQPTRIYAYNGANWVDFGANDSTNTKALYGYKSSSAGWVRATLNKQVVTDYYYKQGQYNLPYGTGRYWSFNPTAENFDSILQMEICKVSSGDQVIYRSYDSNGNTWMQVTWLNDGRISVYSIYNGQATTNYSSNAIGLNTWVSLVISWGHGSRFQRINFNGTLTDATNFNENAGINRSAYIGSNGIRFRNYVLVRMSQYGSASPSEISGYVQNGNFGTPTAVTHTNWV